MIVTCLDNIGVKFSKNVSIGNILLGEKPDKYKVKYTGNSITHDVLGYPIPKNTFYNSVWIVL